MAPAHRTVAAGLMMAAESADGGGAVQHASDAAAPAERAALDALPCGLIRYLDDGTLVYANATAGRLLGHTPELLIGRSLDVVLTPGARAFQQDHVLPLLKRQQRADEICLTLRRRGGGELPVLLQAARAVVGAQVVNTCVFLPMYRLRQMEDALLEARRGSDVAHAEQAAASEALAQARSELAAGAERLRVITDHLPSLVGGIDMRGRLTFLSHAVQAWFGRSRNALLGRPLLEWVAESDQPRLADDLVRALRGEDAVFEGTLVGGVNGPRWVRAVLVPEREVTPEGGQARPEHLPRRVTGAFVLVSDLTERRQAEAAAAAEKERARHAPEGRIETGEPGFDASGPARDPAVKSAPLARHDPLTGLPDRTLLDDRVAQALAHATRRERRVALLSIDLDCFKLVNDRHGEGVGDRLLQDFALRLVRAVRASDTVCRLGGDSFVVLLTDVGAADEAARVAEKLMGVVVRPFQVDGQVIEIGLSIGIALSPDDGDDLDTLCRHADAAMGEAKQSGGGAYRFRSRPLNRRAAEHRVIHDALRRALADGQLYLNWQPDVALESGRIVGVEALLRWTHPQLGEVAPLRFLPVAEDTGLIVPIGAWVLREACLQARAWNELVGGRLPVTVNLSAAQLRDTAFADQVGEALRASGLPPQLLNLELPEAVLMRAYDEVQRLLARAVALGVRVAIDDFGRGKASFADLQHLPVSTLKLDPSFVRAAPRDPAAAAILKAVIAMARGLKRRTIAEGIERSEQVEWLRANGCAQGQGFLFGLPLSTGAMTQRLQQQHDALAQRAVAAATLATAAVAGGSVPATPTASAALAVSAAFGATVAPGPLVDPGTPSPR